MRKEEKFNNILNDCLDRILKGESVEQCLLSYPEQARELEPLLLTAKAARVISTVQPSPEYSAEAKRQFQAALIEMKVKQNEGKAQSGRRFQWRWQSAWAISLVAVVIVVLGGGGTIAAASGSMPDSGLYPVKIAVENVQLALTPGQVAKTELNAKFADRRVEEIIYTAEKGNAQEAQSASIRLNTNLSNISQLAAGNTMNKSDSARKATPLMAPQSSELSKNAAPSLLNSATVPSPVAAPEITATNGTGEPVTPVSAEDTGSAATSAVSMAVQSGNTDSAAATVTSQGTERWAGPNSVKVSITKSEKMIQIIQEDYAKRKAKLEQALQKASPKARPFIQQAITQSDLEYEQALKNLANN
jgi:hypothetical protein